VDTSLSLPTIPLYSCVKKLNDIQLAPPFAYTRVDGCAEDF
jgi:hypothetical protein